MVWYNNSWNYRKEIIISNTGSLLTNYQVLITIDTTSLVNSVPISKMRSDCNDIRFTSSDGSTLLNYWIESGPNTVSTKIWVKIPSITNGSNTIYLYYGNPSATSASNGTNTFDFFDDFSSGPIDTNKWTIVAGSPSVTDGILTVPANGSIIKSTLTFASPLKLIFNSSYASSGGGSTSIIQGMFLTPTNERMFHYADKDGNNSFYIAKAGIQSTPTTNWTNGYSTRKIAWDTTIPSVRWYQNDLESLASPMTTSSYIPIVSLPIYFQSAGTASNINVDYVFIAKLGLSEPTVSTDTEQTPPNITATAMSVTPNENPCRTGICTVTVIIRWSNSGGTDGIVIPNIKIDTISQTAHASRNVIAGSYIDETFTLSDLPAGTHAICPDPN